MKSVYPLGDFIPGGRSPHGERGLKLDEIMPILETAKSLPPRGAWIEIRETYIEIKRIRVAPPTGSVD